MGTAANTIAVGSVARNEAVGSAVPSSAGANPSNGRGRVFTMLIGSMRLPVIQRLVREGRMPAFARLLREGALGAELLNLCVNKTHAGVISALTGATPGTHRAITILRSTAGRPPMRQDLLGKICQAEYLWEAAERQGKRVIVFNVPDCWPPKLKRGILIGGASLTINATLYEGPFDRTMGYPTFQYSLAADELFSTEPAQGCTSIQLQPVASSAARQTGVRTGLAARLALSCNTPDRELRAKPVLWLVAPEGDSSALIYEEGRWSAPLARVATGQWSSRLDFSVPVAAGPAAVACRIKLLAYEPGPKHARVYVSPLGMIDDGRVFPAGSVPELSRLRTFPIASSVVMNRAAGLLDPDSQSELLAMSGDWYLDALGALLRRPFDLFAFHTNDLDWGEHAANKHYRNGLSRAECEAFIELLYVDLDRQVGRIMRMLPPDTTLMILSPHGIICPWHVQGGRNAGDILAEAGLMLRTSAGEIDYDRSRAYPAPEGEGLINVTPWQPENVEQEAARLKNLRLACGALSSATHPSTGERVFSLVLPWEEATPFGLHGPRLADIVTFRPAPSGGMHGPCYPLTAAGESTLKGYLIAWGRGIAAGRQETRAIYLEDFAPTAAHLLGIRPPAHSEGRVIHGMLS